MKRNNKFLGLGIIIASIFVFQSVSTYNIYQQIEQSESSYTRTSYDFILGKPSFEQIDDYNTRSETIKSKAAYNFYGPISKQNTTKTLFLLGVQDYLNLDVTFFSDERMVSGTVNKDGILLDQKAANILGASIGDTLTFSIQNLLYSLEVSAIYQTNTFYLTSGIAMFVMTDELVQKMSQIAYDLFFLDVEEPSDFFSEFQSYIPYGLLTSQEKFVSDFKSSNTKPNDMTNDEWESQIMNAYLVYFNSFVSASYPGYVKNKAIIATPILAENIALGERSIQTLLIINVVLMLIYFGCFIAFFKLESQWQERSIANGSSKTYLVVNYTIKYFLGMGVIFIVGVLLPYILYPLITNSLNEIYTNVFLTAVFSNLYISTFLAIVAYLVFKLVLRNVNLTNKQIKFYQEEEKARIKLLEKNDSQSFLE
jgi:hypothetical protein